VGTYVLPLAKCTLGKGIRIERKIKRINRTKFLLLHKNRKGRVVAFVNITL
jgi:hypothetical protein